MYASITGLGAILVQRASKTEPFHPVMYKSRSLKEVETQYTPTERDALAVRWACKKLRKYLLGAPKFSIVTDHRPLTYMFHKLCGEQSPRVEKLVMDVQEFSYEVVYRTGKTCIADYMSRHHAKCEGSSRVTKIEAAVHSAVSNRNAVMPSTNTDQCHSQILERRGKRMRLIKAVQSGDSEDNEELKPYMATEIKHELSVIDGVVCRGSRIVVPVALQSRVAELSHRAHQGMSKAKNYLRTFCWFPGMDKAVETQVRECLSLPSRTTPIYNF